MSDNEDFVPSKPAGFSGGSSTGEPRNYPVPKNGSRRARVSLIVDIGTQIRGDSYKTADGKLCNVDTPGAIATPQKDAKQVVVFADLVNDNVDYGGEIGKAPYRLMLNGSFGGILKGINHAVSTPPKDGNGNTIKGGTWTMHPQNLLTKLAKATGMDEVIASGAINRLLNKQFMAQVDVSEKDSGKVDADGEAIIYRNVNFKGASPVAPVETADEDEDGNPIEVMPEFAQLKVPAKCITFTNAKKDDIKFIRANVLKMIKSATDYVTKDEKGNDVPSNMKIAIDAYEAERKAAAPADDEEDEKPAAKPAPAKKAPAAKKPVKQSDDNEDVPF